MVDADPRVGSKAYEKLTVAELKEELKKRGLPVTGRKTELISRLHDCNGGSDEAIAADAAAEDGAGRVRAASLDSMDDKGAEEHSRPADIIAARKARFGLASLTEGDRLEKRKERFNIVTEDEKRAARAARFHASEAAPAVYQDSTEVEARKLDRAKRFNVHCPELEEQRKQARSERFAAEKGSVEKEKLSSADLAALIKRR